MGWRVRMKEKLLYRWQRKNDELKMDIQSNERKLMYARERQGALKYDILTQLIIAVSCILIFKFLYYMEPGIMFPLSVLYFYFIRFMTIVAVIYNVYQLTRAIKNYFHHTKVVMEWVRPKPRISNRETGLEPETSIQLEIQKITWILEQYQSQKCKLEEIKYRIDTDDSLTIEMLEQELERIIIYEPIRSSKK